MDAASEALLAAGATGGRPARGRARRWVAVLVDADGNPIGLRGD